MAVQGAWYTRIVLLLLLLVLNTLLVLHPCLLAVHHVVHVWALNHTFVVLVGRHTFYWLGQWCRWCRASRMLPAVTSAAVAVAAPPHQPTRLVVLYCHADQLGVWLVRIVRHPPCSCTRRHLGQKAQANGTEGVQSSPCTPNVALGQK
jgi:hypothetical protein